MLSKLYVCYPNLMNHCIDCHGHFLLKWFTLFSHRNNKKTRLYVRRVCSIALSTEKTMLSRTKMSTGRFTFTRTIIDFPTEQYRFDNKKRDPHGQADSQTGHKKRNFEQWPVSVNKNVKLIRSGALTSLIDHSCNRKYSIATFKLKKQNLRIS